jgi:hypothetical protein
MIEKSKVTNEVCPGIDCTESRSLSCEYVKECSSMYLFLLLTILFDRPST